MNIRLIAVTCTMLALSGIEAVFASNNLNFTLGFEIPRANKNVIVIKSQKGKVSGKLYYRDAKFGRMTYQFDGQIISSQVTTSGRREYKFTMVTKDGAILRGTAWKEVRWTDPYSAQIVNIFVGYTSSPSLFHQTTHRIRLESIAGFIMV